MFIRRDGRGSGRFVWLRTSLFFLGAGIWAGGVLVGNPWVTGVAIAVLALALVLRFAPQRQPPPDEEPEREAEE